MSAGRTARVLGAALLRAVGVVVWLAARANDAANADAGNDRAAPVAVSAPVTAPMTAPAPAPTPVERPVRASADEAPAVVSRPAPAGQVAAEAARDPKAQWSVPSLDVALEGVVSTMEGEPVVGAELAFYVPGALPRDPAVQAATGATDAQGRYRLAGLKGFARGRLDCAWQVALTGHTARLELHGVSLRLDGPNVVDLVVPAPTTSIRQAVLVEEPQGTPLAEHRVELITTEGATGGHGRRLVEGADITGPDGRCLVPALTFGTKDVVVYGPGAGDLWDWSALLGAVSRDMPPRRTAYAIVSVEARKAVAVTELEGAELVLQVARHDMALLTGFLFDERGLPLDFESSALPSGARGLTTDDGDFVLLLDDGDFELLAPKGARTVRLLSPCFVGLPTLSYDTQFRQDFGSYRVSRAAGLHITLRDTADGLFVPQPSVTVRFGDDSVPDEQTPLHELGDGSYVIWSGRSAGRFTLTATAPGYVTVTLSGALQPGSAPVALLVPMDPEP
jgi:hypothetical protein